MQKKSQNEKKSYEISLSLFLLFLFFTIISKAQDVEHINLKKPVTFHGNLNFQLDYYSANGIPARQKEFSWIINGNPVLNVLGIDLPFTFLFFKFWQ